MTLWLNIALLSFGSLFLVIAWWPRCKNNLFRAALNLTSFLPTPESSHLFFLPLILLLTLGTQNADLALCWLDLNPSNTLICTLSANDLLSFPMEKVGALAKRKLPCFLLCRHPVLECLCSVSISQPAVNWSFVSEIIAAEISLKSCSCADMITANPSVYIALHQEVVRKNNF